MFTTSEELINKIHADSPQATEDFLKAYYPYIKVLLRHYGCPSQAVEDLCTPVALKLLKALKTFDRRRPGSLRKLINLIVQRTVANFYKKMNAKNQQPNKNTTELVPEMHERNLKVDWQMSDCSILHEICTTAIQNYLNRVEPVTYKALKMYVMEYRNAQEVSDLLEIPANSVYNHKRNFFLRIVDDATELYEQKTGDKMSKVSIAEALYNYLLDNNPALTIAESPLPDKLLKQFSFLKNKIDEVQAPDEKGTFLKFLNASLDWQKVNNKVIIGSRKADLIVNDPKVSGPHCQLSIDEEGDTYLEDLHSENGTYVNGKKIQKQLLLHADLIQLGSGTNIIFYQVD